MPRVTISKAGAFAGVLDNTGNKRRQWQKQNHWPCLMLHSKGSHEERDAARKQAGLSCSPTPHLSKVISAVNTQRRTTWPPTTSDLATPGTSLQHSWSPNPTHHPHPSVEAEHVLHIGHTNPNPSRGAQAALAGCTYGGDCESGQQLLHVGTAAMQELPEVRACMHTCSPHGNQDPFAHTNKSQTTHDPPGRATFTDLTHILGFDRYKGMFQPFMMVNFSSPRVTTRNFPLKILGILFNRCDLHRNMKTVPSPHSSVLYLYGYCPCKMSIVYKCYISPNLCCDTGVYDFELLILIDTSLKVLHFWPFLGNLFFMSIITLPWKSSEKNWG